MDAHSCRDGRGGGAAIYISKTLQFNIINQTNSNLNNVITINLPQLSLKILAFYKQPSSCNYRFIDYLEEVLSNTKNLILIGDVNINLLEENCIVSEYLNTIQSNGYRVLNNIAKHEATRVDSRNGHRSIIDHIITDIPCDMAIHLKDHYISDHKIINISFNIDTLKPTKSKQIYKTELCNHKKLEDNLHNILVTTDLSELDFQQLSVLIQEQLIKATTTVEAKVYYKYRRRVVYRRSKNQNEGKRCGIQST